MADKREYVVNCEHVSEHIWVPVRLWVLENEDCVVRCENCKNIENPYGENAICGLHGFSVKLDDFCSWGEVNVDG